jgi:hypothetical protein
LTAADADSSYRVTRIFLPVTAATIVLSPVPAAAMGATNGI